LFDGIGNAYSDEILRRAKLSPVSLTGRITDANATTLYHAARTVLSEWVDRLRTEAGEKFPERVTPVQRIRYATNETDYCARCQTGGRLLADRALSRLLKKDWPRSVDDI